MDVRANIRARAKKPLTDDEEVLLNIAGIPGSWDFVRVRVLQKLLMAVLKTAKGNQCEASRRLGMHRNSFNRILRGKG